ncbi:NEK kinase [Toxoplasma gondii GAB2-2007-GAL-DOM2]|uniref:non-specific serine/threonine protein kinase n=5 Tax=Toxoplasma gondii TaxID=5811 RepID=S7UHC5_TOXGG|nr:NEK kinase [Toxoplasma gondii GT1]KAF4644130.1 NEK kinase [Toxoplasma gondii]KFG38765.1 NEK kinase [Toxoplasma gondii GAB2-2007-GAL-DOM2]KFG43154.1 NEK kinase [Toxoplasma gondii FOU]RQX74119.1 NEK kinase [Toxoplasma gondii CAST]
MIGLEQRQAALKESTILQDLSAHPNVITYFNNKLDRKKQILHIIIEYADGGDLEQQIHLRRNLLEEQLEAGRTKNESSPPSADHQDLSNYAPFFFKEEHVLLVFVQTLAGLFHLHSRSILHRDIKSQNIFLSSDGLIKLGDFGIARRLNKDNMAETYVGSPCYMSPELYKREPYNYKSDIWALGCVLFELCCLRKPFHGSNIVVLAMQVTSNKPPAHLDTPPGLYPPPLHHLVNRMLQVDPAERPSAAEIMATPYILRSMKKLIKRYPQLHYLQCYLNDLSCSVAKELPPSNPPFDGCDSSEANRASAEHFPENSYHAEIKYNSEPLPAASNVESKTKPAAERVGGRSSTRPVAGNTEDKVYLSDEPQRPSFITLKALLNESLVFDE